MAAGPPLAWRRAVPPHHAISITAQQSEFLDPAIWNGYVDQIATRGWVGPALRRMARDAFARRLTDRASWRPAPSSSKPMWRDSKTKTPPNGGAYGLCFARGSAASQDARFVGG
jgi:hypothetical protein